MAKQNSNTKAIGAVAPKSHRTLTIVIAAVVAFLLLAAIVTGAVLMIIEADRKDSGFDYIKSDLSRYVELSESDYKDYKLSLNVAKPHDIDVDIAILNLIASEENRKLEGDGVFKKNATVTPGDVVQLWYRAYMIEEDGTKTSMMNNMGATVPTEVTVGSNGMYVYAGFELGLVGKNGTDYATFEKITSGDISADQVIYVSYTRDQKGATDSSNKKTSKNVRIDLAEGKEAIDKLYGAGFYDILFAEGAVAKIGSPYTFDVKLNSKDYTYTDMTVDFATLCEKPETEKDGKSPLLIECYFPYDEDVTLLDSLRNKPVYFEVYIDYVQAWSTPEFNDEFVKEFVNTKESAITEAELLEYEGDSYVEKYRAYAKKYLDDAYEEAYEAALQDAMWEHYHDKAKIKKFPGIKLDEVYNEYVNDVYYQFETSGGYIATDSEGNGKTYDNVDDFAVAYLGLTYEENPDWRAELMEIAEYLVKERLVLFYVMQREGLVPTEAKLNEKIAALKAEYLEEFIDQYLAKLDKDRDDYSDEEYADFVEDMKKKLIDYFGEDHFVETAYYEIAFESLKKYPKVTTLDDKLVPEDK